MIVLFWFYVIPSLLTITFFLIKKYCCGKVIMRFKCIEYKNVNLYHGHSVITHEYKPVIYSKANIRGKFENYWYIYPYSLGKQINYWNFTKTYTRKTFINVKNSSKWHHQSIPGTLTNLLTSCDSERPQTHLRHFNAFPFSYVSNALQTTENMNYFFITYLFLSCQDTDIYIWSPFLIFCEKESIYIYPKVNFLWKVRYSYFVHILELLTSVFV